MGLNQLIKLRIQKLDVNYIISIELITQSHIQNITFDFLKRA